LQKIFFITLFIFSLSVPAQEKDQALETFNEITALMDKHYFDPTYSGLDWPKESKEARAKISKADSQEKKYMVISDTLAKLAHSHLVFSPPFQTKKKETLSIPQGSPKEINFDLELLDGQWVVTSVTANSDAEKAGLKMGQVVIKLNQWPVAELYQDEGAMAYYYMRSLLMNYPKSTMKLTVKNFDGTEQVISFGLTAYNGTYESLGLINDRAEFEQKLLSEKIGYIRFSIFLVSPVKKAIAAIKQMRDLGVEGIIVDLRNNPGGVAMLAPAIVKEFCTVNYNLGTQTGRDSTLTFPVFAQPKPYKGQVVILQNKQSASTSELLSGGMRTNESALIIGENSAGMALPSVMVSLKDGSVFQYPVADFKTTKGENIEGDGVAPHIKVSHTLEALSEGKDLYIETAIKAITKEK
jgi:carboxyl-terminal processing protease